MQLEITGLNYQVDDYTRDLIVKKVVKSLDRLLTSYANDLKTARIKIEKRTRWGYKVKFYLQLAGEDLFSEAVNEDLPDALVEVRKEMEKQVKKLMEKLQNYSKN